jgi:hypothetical protein
MPDYGHSSIEIRSITASLSHKNTYNHHDHTNIR